MSRTHPLALALASLAIALPWLNPFAPGPFPPAMQWVVTLAAAGSVAAWVAWFRPSRDDLAQAALDGWLLAALVSSAIGVCQYLGWADSLSPWMNSSALGQAYANLRQRNQFATLCSMGLACVLWGRFSWFNLAPWGTGLMAALLGLGSAVSASRTGFVQLLFLAVCVLWWKGRRPWAVLGAAFVGFAVGLIALPHFLGLDPFAQGLLARIGGDADPCNSRVALWRNVLHLVAQKPWTGWGWGELGFAHYMVLQPDLRFCDILDNAHNLFLQIAVELGLPAMLLLLLALASLIVKGRVLVETRPLLRVSWAVAMVILLHSMLEYPLWYGPFLMAAVLAVLTVWPRRRESTGDAEFAASLIWGRVGLVLAVLLFAAAAFTAWEYRGVSQIFLPPAERVAGYEADTLAKLRHVQLFRRYVAYAELTTTPVTAQSAERVRELALEVLHFSAEPRVIEKLLDASFELHDNETLLAHMARYEAAFPKEYKRWRAGLPEEEVN